MNSLQPGFDKQGFDLAQWKHAMHRHPQEYIRRKLRVVQTYHQTHSMQAVVSQHHLHKATVRTYLNTYIEGGLLALCTPQTNDRMGSLTAKQEAAFKHQLLHSRPTDHGLEGSIWTGAIMRVYLHKVYSVVYRSGIYDLLKRLNLSHQKAHSDYGNADPIKQQAFLDTLKDTLLEADETHAVVAFDEFSVCEKPTSYYGWAERNTRPVHVTNEKKASDSTAS